MAAPLMAALFSKGGALAGKGLIAGQGPSQIGGVGAAGMFDLGGRLSGIVGGIGGFITSGIQADTLRIQAKAAEDAAEFNAKQSEQAAERVVELAKDQEGQLMERGSEVIGQQRAAFASQGVKVGRGVVSQVEAQTRRTVAEDIDALRSNAFHQALGLKAQAFNQRNAGMVQAGNLRAQATNTMISGGASLAKGVLGAIKVG